MQKSNKKNTNINSSHEKIAMIAETLALLEEAQKTNF